MRVRRRRHVFVGLATLVLAAGIPAAATGQDRAGPQTAADREIAAAEELYLQALQARETRDADRANALFREAEAGFRRALRRDPDKINAVARLSLILYATHRSQEALPIVTAARRRHPDDVDLKQQLGVHLYALHRAAEARPLLEEVVAADADRFDAHLLLGGMYYQDGREWEKAIASYQAYLRTRPGRLSSTDVQVMGRIGNSYLALHQYREARGAYQRIIERDSHQRDARINIAYTFYLEGNYREATTRYEAILRLGDPPPIVLANLARALWKLGRVPQALDRARQVQRLQPRSHFGYLVESEILLDRRNVRGAVTKVRAALERAPRDVPTLLQAGKAMLAAGDVTSAERHLGSARTIAPNDLDVTGATAALYRSTRREAQAKPLFEELTRARPRDADAWYGLGACQYVLGEAEAAATSFRAAIERRADHAQAKAGLIALLNRTATAAAGRGEVAEAKAELERALTIDPASALVHRNLAEILLVAGQSQQALDHLGRSGSFATTRDGAYLSGRALLALGRAEDAVAKLTAALAARGRATDDEVIGALGIAESLAGQHDSAVNRLRAALGSRPPPEKSRVLATVLWRRAVDRLSGRHGRDALADLGAADDYASSLSRENRDRLAFTFALGYLVEGDGRRALSKLQPLSRVHATWLEAAYEPLGIEYFTTWGRYLSNDFRAFFNGLRTIRARATGPQAESIAALEINARIRNAEALFARGATGPATAEMAAIRGGTAHTNALVRLADACLQYARGRRNEAGVIFEELAQRVRAGSDDVPREAWLDVAIYRDQVKNDDAAAVQAYRRYVELNGRHAEVARRVLERKRRVLGVGGEAQ